MYRIGQVAAQLDISPSTLRRWSDRFSDWLSDEGGNPAQLDNGRRAVRMYSDSDIEVLLRIRQLKEEGLTEDEIAERFEAQSTGEESTALLKRSDGEIVLSREAAAAIQMLQKAVDGQQAIITAQQAQRDLLNAVIADALALQEENERLRRRQRVLEEEMARLKESDWNHRFALEERMNQVERRLQQAEAKPPWWRRLFGG